MDGEGVVGRSSLVVRDCRCCGASLCLNGRDARHHTNTAGGDDFGGGFIEGGHGLYGGNDPLGLGYSFFDGGGNYTGAQGFGE